MSVRSHDVLRDKKLRDEIVIPSKFEDDIFKFWIESKLFDKKNIDKIKYSIILPPPNII